MSPDEFAERLRQVEQELRSDPHQEQAKLLESEALAAANANFRNQGWEGAGWKPSKGTILVKSGRLRGGFETMLGPGQVRVVNRVPYAVIHNEGLSGTAQVPEHRRVKKGGNRKKGTIKGFTGVRAHSRRYNMPQRQFAPYEGSRSATLDANVRAKLEAYIREKFTLNGLL